MGSAEQRTPVRQNTYGVTDDNSTDSLERVTVKRTRKAKEARSRSAASSSQVQIYLLTQKSGEPTTRGHGGKHS